MKTTLNKIRACHPCGIHPREYPRQGYLRLVDYLGVDFDPDAHIDITTIIDSNGIGDALWCLRAVDGNARAKRLIAVRCVRPVQHLMKDPQSIDALDIAERHALGLATDAELSAAAYAAKDAAAYAAAAYAATAAATAAAYAAATAAAYAAAYAAADADYAAYAVADAAYAAATAVADAAAYAAADAVADAAAIHKEQERVLRDVCALVALTLEC